jgi:tripartite-type tricarboxylate transporter receptor subunit TctC
MVADSWNGLLAPAGTPPAILKKLHEAATAAMNSPDIKDKLESQGALVIANTPDEFKAEIRQEVSEWTEQFKRIKIEQQ